MGPLEKDIQLYGTVQHWDYVSTLTTNLINEIK